MDDNYGCASIIVLIALLFMIMFGVNSCSESDWNNGECPDCGKEVERY